MAYQSQMLRSMEFIWDRIPKQKDGKTIRYLKGDIAYLYYHGFVDTLRFKLEDWEKAFSPFKQPDGSYVLGKDEFILLTKFRYRNTTYKPFDPSKIEEGSWPDKALKGFYIKTISRATTIPENVYWDAINKLKKAGQVDKDGNFVIDANFKKFILRLIVKYPSPRTILECEVERIKRERDEKAGLTQKNRDASGFSVGQTAKEAQIEELNRLQGTASASAQATTITSTHPESIDLKSLRKKNPGGKFKG